jgi:hypothetical protein
LVVVVVNVVTNFTKMSMDLMTVVQTQRDERNSTTPRIWSGDLSAHFTMAAGATDLPWRATVVVLILEEGSLHPTLSTSKKSTSGLWNGMSPRTPSLVSI